jgi:hypothetical protein
MYRYEGLLGKVAFMADMAAAGHAPDEIELKWIERNHGYGSPRYVILKLAQQMGVCPTEAAEALMTFEDVTSSAGQTLH